MSQRRYELTDFEWMIIKPLAQQAEGRGARG
jgi:hypothetical protein